MERKTCLASITGTVDQELLLRNEYLAVENRILRKQITGRVPLNDGERKTFAGPVQQSEKKALKSMDTICKPETILAWNRKLIAKKFDGTQHRRYPGGPRLGKEIEQLIAQFVQDNRSWAYARIVGVLKYYYCEAA